MTAATLPPPARLSTWRGRARVRLADLAAPHIGPATPRGLHAEKGRGSPLPSRLECDDPRLPLTTSASNAHTRGGTCLRRRPLCVRSFARHGMEKARRTWRSPAAIGRLTAARLAAHPPLLIPSHRSAAAWLRAFSTTTTTNCNHLSGSTGMREGDRSLSFEDERQTTEPHGRLRHGTVRPSPAQPSPAQPRLPRPARPVVKGNEAQRQSRLVGQLVHRMLLPVAD